MKTTMTISANFNCSPFEIFNQDLEDVIVLINYYIYLGEQENNNTQTTATTKPVARNKTDRIRVNDKTATGGWF